MKSFSMPPRLALFSLPVALLVLALGGCGSEPPPPPKPAGGANAPKPPAKAPTFGVSSNAGESVISAPGDYVGGVIAAGEKARGTVEIMTIRKAIDSFHEQENSLPASLDELREKKYLPAMPRPPIGMMFEYNKETGEVKLVPKPQE